MPAWFGIPEANDAYIAFAAAHDTWIAYATEGTPVGFISGRMHFDETAEIGVMAVRPEWHRQGLRRALANVFEAYHRSYGTRMLEVKTLGPSRDNAHYTQTPRTLADATKVGLTGGRTVTHPPADPLRVTNVRGTRYRRWASRSSMQDRPARAPMRRHGFMSWLDR